MNFDGLILRPLSSLTRSLNAKLANWPGVTTQQPDCPETNRHPQMMPRYPILIAVLCLAVLTSCQSGAEETPAATNTATSSGANPFDQMSTFSGSIPCASCPGIEMTVQFRPDGTAVIRSVYLEAENGEDRMVNNIARWAFTADGRIIVVRDGTEGGRRFGVVSPDTLQMLNNLGQTVVSDLAYELIRIESDPIVGDMKLSGMYQYYADAALINLCQTRMRYPVALEEAHVALEEAYLAAEKEPQQALYATFVGRIERRPPMEGEERDFVIVSEFDSLNPGGSCFEQELPVEATVWTLIELNGRAVSVADRTRVPNLVMIDEDNRAAGSDGCNRFTGGYTLNGDSLSFGQMASTQMACPDGVELARNFTQVLASTTMFDQYGDMLELWEGNRLLARFEGSEIE